MYPFAPIAGEGPQKFGSDSEHLPVFKALCGDDQEQNAGMIQASNPENLPVFKAPGGDNPEQNAETIRNRTRGQSTHPIQNTSLFLRLYAGKIRNRTR